MTQLLLGWSSFECKAIEAVLMMC